MAIKNYDTEYGAVKEVDEQFYLYEAATDRCEPMAAYKKINFHYDAQPLTHEEFEKVCAHERRWHEKQARVELTAPGSLTKTRYFRGDV